MARETRESSFDELARGLASGSVSRAKALRLMGAALVGGTLGSLGIGEAAADNLCKPLDKKCRKDAQCCTGLSCQNGTCAPCTSNGGTCSANDQCCSRNCSNGFCCPSGRVGLSNGTCAKLCGSLQDCPPGCVGCFIPIGGAPPAFCGSGEVPESSCTSDDDCPRGQFCGTGACIVAC
jgi:Dickkopf N-terminal cysteine-rich region